MIRSAIVILLCGLIAIAAIYLALVAFKGRKGALALVFGPVVREVVDFKQLQLKATPNQYLVCPLDYCTARAHAAAPVFTASVDRLREAWFEMLAEQPATTVISRDEPNRQFDIETLTPLIGFPDTVTVKFLDVPGGGSSLAIYSRSHYGRSDLGANKKRIAQWLGQLAVKIGPNG